MSKRLINKIGDSLVVVTQCTLECKRCKLIYNVTNNTIEELVNEGWTLYKPDKRFGAILICGRCSAYVRANS